MADMSKQSVLELGSVMVETTQNKGHDPEFWAEQITKKICDISADAAPHVRQQAEAFRQQVYEVVLRGIKSAIASDRTTLSVILRRQGHNQMADLLKEL